MEDLTREVEKLAKEYRMDLIGFANIERFENFPDGHHPKNYLAGCKSVIVVVSAMPSAIIDAWKYSPNSYLYYCYMLINKELGRAAFYIAKFLERCGYKTFPVVPTVLFKDTDYINPRGEISHIHSALACGLGEFGVSNNFITPQFGAHNRFCSILTEAELQPSSLYEGEPLCDKCMKCVKACPTKAINPDKMRKIKIAGKDVEYASFDKMKCFYCILGLAKEAGGVVDIKIPKKDKFTIYDILKGRARAFLKEPIKYSFQAMSQHVIDWGDYCGRCLHVCDRPIKKAPVLEV